MDIEQQVCSLELAEKLKELCIKQESYFYYGRNSLTETVEVGHYSQHWPANISAFTAPELGDILPNHITTIENEPFNNYRICLTKFYSVSEKQTINNYIINYECDSTEIHGENAWLRRRLTNNIYDPNLANAMAKMLIYLIENKIITV